MSVYVATGNSAGTMVVGIYSDANGHPGTLLTKGTKTGLTAGAWNTVTVPAASISSAKTYWVGLLGTGGTLRFRGGSAAGCRSEGSRSSTLSTLPSTWADRHHMGHLPAVRLRHELTRSTRTAGCDRAPGDPSSGALRVSPRRRSRSRRSW